MGPIFSPGDWNHVFTLPLVLSCWLHRMRGDSLAGDSSERFLYFCNIKKVS